MKGVATVKVTIGVEPDSASLEVRKFASADPRVLRRGLRCVSGFIAEEAG